MRPTFLQLIISISLLFCFNKIFGQNNNIDIVLAKTFFTSGDLWGNQFGVSYLKQSGKFVSVGLEYQNSRSTLKEEQTVPGFISVNNQINASGLLLRSNISLINSRLILGGGLGIQNYKKFSNGGLRTINDPIAFSGPTIIMETGKFLKGYYPLYKLSLGTKLISIEKMSLLFEFSVSKSKTNTESSGGLKLSYRY